MLPSSTSFIHSARRHYKYIDDRKWPTEDREWWKVEDDEFVLMEDFENHYDELMYVPPEDEDEPPPSSPERMQHAKTVAKELLQKKYGQFWIEEYEKSRKTLRIFTNPHMDPEIIELGFELLWRTMQESNVQELKPKWMREANEHTFVVPFLENYRSIALSPTHPQHLFLQPMQLILKMNDMTLLQKNFRFRNASYGILMDVIIGKQTKQHAPYAAEKALQFFKQQAIKLQRPFMTPDVHRYTKTMQAWAVSGNPEAAEKMQDLWNLMNQEKKYPNTVTYNILIRYYGGRGQDDQLDNILEEMERKQRQQEQKENEDDEEDESKNKREIAYPDEITYSQAIYGYIMAKRYNTAEGLMEKLLQLEEVQNTSMISDSARLLLNAYLRQIMDAITRDDELDRDNESPVGSNEMNKKKRGKKQFTTKAKSKSASLTFTSKLYYHKAIDLYERIADRSLDTDEIDEIITQIVSQRVGDDQKHVTAKAQALVSRIAQRSQRRRGRAAIEKALYSSPNN
jgi:pentatricopeptide repeat protein